MPTFRKKPVEVEAVNLRASEPGDPISIGPVGTKVPLWLQDALCSGAIKPILGDIVDGSDWMYLAIETLEGTMIAKTDDWIIRGVQGELYPCKPDIFEQTYEAVEA